MIRSMLSKRFVYFHIDELNRDAVTASALKKELKKRNICLIYGGRTYFRLVKHLAAFFDALIFPKPNFLSYARKSCFSESNIVMLYSENIGVMTDSDNKKLVLKGVLDPEFMSGDHDYVDMVSAFCFWGSNSYDTVVEHYPYLKERCHIVGHPRHSRKALLPKKKNSSPSHKKKIGIITRNTLLSEYYGKNPLEKLALYADDGVMYEYYNKKTNDFLINVRRGTMPENDAFCEAVDAKLTFIIIKEALKRGYDIEVKTHPREDEKVLAKIFREKRLPVSFVDPTTPFAHWLADIDYLVGPPSSCFYDCMMVGVFPISMHRLDARRTQFEMEVSDDNNKLMKYIAAPNSIDELFALLKSNPVVKRTDEINDVLLKATDFPHCADSIEKAANIVETVMQKNIRKSRFVKWCGVFVYSLVAKMVNVVFWLRYWKSKHASASFIVTPSVSRFINNLSFI